MSVFLKHRRFWGGGKDAFASVIFCKMYSLRISSLIFVLQDVIAEDLFFGLYCRNVIKFSPFPGRELTSVQVLCTNKIYNSAC